MTSSRSISALLLTLAAWPAIAQQNQLHIPVTPERPILTINVSETVPGAPDIASVGVGVQSLGMTASAALGDNSTRMEAVIKAILTRKILKKDIQTTGVSLSAEYDYSVQGKPPRFNGYRVSNSVRVVTRDIAKLGELLDTMVTAGGTSIDGPYFAVENPEPSLKIARDKALVKANAQAQAYALRIGFVRARLLSITESGGFNSGGAIPISAFSSDIVVTGQAVSTPVAPGQIGTGVTISVQYQLER